MTWMQILSPLIKQSGIAILLCIVTCASAVCHGREVRFERLLMEGRLEGEDIGAVKVLAQDNLGFIWIGAEYGLARYDATTTTRYPPNPKDPNALADAYINDIYVDSKNTLWIGSDTGLYHYNRASDNFSRIISKENTPNRSTRTTAIDEDSAGNLILSMDLGLAILDPTREHVKYFDIEQTNYNTPRSSTTVFVDADDQIWLGTKGVGAGLFNRETGKFKYFTHDPTDPGSLISNHITSIAQDDNQRLWFGSRASGISRLSPGDKFFTQYTYMPNNPESIASNSIWDIFVDSRGKIWVATDQGGVAVYNETQGYFEHYRHEIYNLNSLSSDQTRTIFEDKRGDIWIGTFPYGLNYYNRSAESFTNYSHQPSNTNSLSHSAILTIYEDRHKTLWIGTERGLNAFEHTHERFKRYVREPGKPYTLQADAVLSVTEDNAGNLWIGTWSGGLHRFEHETQRFYNYAPMSNDPKSLSSSIVWAVLNDRKGRLWMGTEGGGLNLYQPETDNFQQFRHDPAVSSTIDSDYIWTMMEDSRGQIWIGTTNGLNILDPDTKTFTRFPPKPGDNTSCNCNRVRSFMEARDGRIWIGTQDNGFMIYDPASKTFKNIGKGSDLPALYVTGFVEDKQGFVWASTTRGIVRIDPNNMTMHAFTKKHGLSGNTFNREANFIDADGNVYFGSTEGMTVFDPANIETNAYHSPVVITELKILNKAVSIGDDTPLREPIWLSKRLVLNHTHSMFSFDFSELNYRNSAQKQYEYWMKGFDANWNQIGFDHSATFTNLNPGHYTFMVRALNDGAEDRPTASIDIRILPPPWQTWWAYTIYIALFLGLMFLIANTKIKQIQLASERKTNKELLNLNDLKDAFLANTSHELRTPLNGIIGISDALSEYLKEDAFAQHRLQLISSSGRRLANLINDILDYSKLANRNLQLDLEPIDMHEVTESVFNLLAPLSAVKPVDLVNHFNERSPRVIADENRLQQILINLIGNGIKYTPEGSVSVGMEVFENSNSAQIYVLDTGIGIPDNQRKSIFEAFNQIQHANDREYGGTGLGLAITKQLVELHGGKIWAEPGRDGGSKFTFTLDLYDEKSMAVGNLRRAPKPSPPATEPQNTGDEQKTEPEPQKAVDVTQNIPRNAEDQTILVVDDDAVNRIVLNGILSLHNYTIIEAASGQEALDALEVNPRIDLVIMDVMMPHMTGYEATAEIRKKFPIQELPVLFLTAKRNVDDDIAKCFSVGGNDFLTKPVSKNDLLPRITSHLRLASAVRKLKLELGTQFPLNNL